MEATSPPPRPVPSPTGECRAPSPPWYGGLSALLMFGSYGWIFAYTLGPLPGLGVLGGWNYVVAGGLFATSVIMARFWRSG